MKMTQSEELHLRNLIRSAKEIHSDGMILLKKEVTHMSSTALTKVELGFFRLADSIRFLLDILLKENQ